MDKTAKKGTAPKSIQLKKGQKNAYKNGKDTKINLNKLFAKKKNRPQILSTKQKGGS